MIDLCRTVARKTPSEHVSASPVGSRFAETSLAGEERKVVSVLFVDLVGFTNRSDRADPEDVRATLAPVPRARQGRHRALRRHGGEVHRRRRHGRLRRARSRTRTTPSVRCAPALRILDTIEELRFEGLELAVRAAVTTGEAVVALGARPERGRGHRHRGRREYCGSPAVGSAGRRRARRRDRRCAPPRRRSRSSRSTRSRRRGRRSRSGLARAWRAEPRRSA